MQERGAFKMQCKEGEKRLKPSFLILGISYNIFYWFLSLYYFFRCFFVFYYFFDSSNIWKAGTSSLAVTLSKHPQIKYLVLYFICEFYCGLIYSIFTLMKFRFPTAKETFYFSKLHNKLNIEWYWNMFPCGNDSEHTFEATAGYFSFLFLFSSFGLISIFC